MKKHTLSRFFLGLIFGAITGIVAYSIDMPQVAQAPIRTLTAAGMTGFRLLIEVLIWPLGCLAFIDAFRIMWSMIRGHFSGSDSVRTYVATTLMAVLISIIIGAPFILRTNGLMDFEAWTSIRSEFLYYEPVMFSAFYRVPLELFCFASAAVGIFLAEKDRGKTYGSADEPDIFQRHYHRLIQVVYRIYVLLPYFIFLITFELTSRTGGAIFEFVLFYILLVFGLLGLHVALVYSSILMFRLRLSPKIFFSKCMSLVRIAGWTINSKDTEPVTIQIARIKLGVPEGIAREVVHGGTTLNMDGTAIMQAVAILMTGAIYGVSFDMVTTGVLAGILVVIAMVTTAGTLTGMFTLGIVFHIFRIPIELLAVIISVSHVVSTVVTPVNILGDLVVAMVVADEFDKLDRETFMK